MPHLLRHTLFTALTLTLAGTAHACVVCHSTVGHQVRDGILNGRFLPTVLLTIAPFPVFLSLVALIYYRLPLPNSIELASNLEHPSATNIPSSVNF